TPDDFVFSVKGPRYLTHMLRLREPRAALANFFASGVLELGRKLGPILWQLPPNFPFDRDRLAAFFEAVPRTQGEAAVLAARHDARVKDPGWAAADAETVLRHALEVRHPTLQNPGFPEFLRRHEVALTVADSPEWPFHGDATA